MKLLKIHQLEAMVKVDHRTNNNKQLRLFVASGDFGKLGFDIRYAYPWIVSVLVAAITFAF